MVKLKELLEVYNPVRPITKYTIRCVGKWFDYAAIEENEVLRIFGEGAVVFFDTYYEKSTDDNFLIAEVNLSKTKKEVEENDK